MQEMSLLNKFYFTSAVTFERIDVFLRCHFSTGLNFFFLLLSLV